MLRLDRVIKPWKKSAALNDYINLYGFWNETTFLTKSGDVGMVLHVQGVDYESLDSAEQQYAVKRLESALKAFGPGFHIYQYFCFVHPAKAGISSNLNLITDKGNIYSFTLQDVSVAAEMPDLKVLIQPADRSSIVASNGPAQYVPAAQLDQSKQQLAAIQAHITQAVDEYKSAYPLALKFDYTFKANEAPFDIQSIYHDDKFTYIKTDAPEKFSVYEMKDGKPDLVNYDLREGTYIIPKVMDSGYVELGKKRMDFSRKG